MLVEDYKGQAKVVQRGNNIEGPFNLKFCGKLEDFFPGNIPDNIDEIINVLLTMPNKRSRVFKKGQFKIEVSKKDVSISIPNFFDGIIDENGYESLQEGTTVDIILRQKES